MEYNINNKMRPQSMDGCGWVLKWGDAENRGWSGLAFDVAKKQDEQLFIPFHLTRLHFATLFVGGS